jgi:hypothetical protein
MSFDHPVGVWNKWKIIRAVKDFGGRDVSWTEIKERIEKNAERDIKLKQLTKSRHLGAKEKERLIKELRLGMSEQALAKNLKKLVEIGILGKNKDGVYSLTDELLAAQMFGSSALSRLLNFPTSATIKHPEPTSAQDLPQFIERFGMLLIFIFMEGSRKVKDVTMKPKEKDRLATEWVQNAVPVGRMFDVFLSVYGPKDMRYHDGREPSCEIPDNTLDMLHRGLKKHNPKVYEELLDVFADYMGEPKERSLRKNSKKPGYFIYPAG